MKQSYSFLTLVVLLFSMSYSGAIEQVSFNHIIFSPLLQSIKQNNSLSESFGAVLFGKMKNGVSRKIILKKGSDEKTVELEFQDLKGVSFVIYRDRNGLISRIEKNDNGKKTCFSRKTLSDDKRTHFAFSNNKIYDIYKAEDNWLNSDKNKIDVEIFFYKNDHRNIFVSLHIKSEDYIRYFNYREDSMYSSAGFLIQKNNPLLIFSLHMHKDDSLFIGDFCKYDKNGNGYYCEFYKSGFLKNYVERKNKKWEKQKYWKNNGSFEGEYSYPPGKQEQRRAKINNFFPTWMVYTENIKSFKPRKAAYWNKSAMAPYYKCLATDQHNNRFVTEFFFSNNINLINCKFQSIKEAYNHKIEKNLTKQNPADFDGFILKNSDTTYKIYILQNNMIFSAEGENYDNVVDFSNKVISSYKNNQK